jgi:hypothetical protein
MVMLEWKVGSCLLAICSRARLLGTQMDKDKSKFLKQQQQQLEWMVV